MGPGQTLRAFRDDNLIWKWLTEMCALCGAFGVAEHWTDRRGEETSVPPPAERRRRAAAANDVLGLYGLKLAEWGGRFTLQSRTGKMAVVDNFGALWPEAERLSGRPCDPLDPAVIAALETDRDRR